MCIYAFRLFVSDSCSFFRHVFFGERFPWEEWPNLPSKGVGLTSANVNLMHFQPFFPSKKETFFSQKKRCAPKGHPLSPIPQKNHGLSEPSSQAFFRKFLSSLAELKVHQLSWGDSGGFCFFFDANKTSTFRKPLIFWGVVSWMCFFCFF